MWGQLTTTAENVTTNTNYVERIMAQINFDSMLDSNSMLVYAKLEYCTHLVLRILHFLYRHEKGSNLQFVAQQYWPVKILQH